MIAANPGRVCAARKLRFHSPNSGGNDSDQSAASVGAQCVVYHLQVILASVGRQCIWYMAATAQFSGDALASFLSVFWVDVNADSCMTELQCGQCCRPGSSEAVQHCSAFWT